MTQEEVEQILKNIVDLAHALGWSTVMVQTMKGSLLGMHLGPRDWLVTKTGIPPEVKH